MKLSNRLNFPLISMAKILEGKKLSLSLAKRLADKVKRLKIKPKLVIIQIGNLEESNTYIKNKKNFAEKIGVLVEHKIYPQSVKEAQIIKDISRYNKDSSIHGIMVQLPGPKNFNVKEVLNTIDYKKDVDGLRGGFIPATALGAIALLDQYKIQISGKKVVVVGSSNLVGKPLALALVDRGATVTICHKDTKNLPGETRRADILISAVGLPKLITLKHVSKNQTVIDIGITVTKDGKVVGDVDFKKVSKIVRAITPVPGGVGPMTVASLFQNLLKA